MTSVSIEVATADVEKWLDFKKVRETKREKFAETVENLIEGFQDGLLTLDEETGEITQHLQFPANGIEKLVFKPRIDVGSVNLHLTKVKPGDSDGRVLAYVCALTGKLKAEIAKMDLEDYNVSGNIAVFFF